MAGTTIIFVQLHSRFEIVANWLTKPTTDFGFHLNCNSYDSSLLTFPFSGRLSLPLRTFLRLSPSSKFTLHDSWRRNNWRIQLACAFPLFSVAKNELKLLELVMIWLISQVAFQVRTFPADRILQVITLLCPLLGYASWSNRVSLSLTTPRFSVYPNYSEQTILPSQWRGVRRGEVYRLLHVLERQCMLLRNRVSARRPSLWWCYPVHLTHALARFINSTHQLPCRWYNCTWLDAHVAFLRKGPNKKRRSVGGVARPWRDLPLGCARHMPNIPPPPIFSFNHESPFTSSHFCVQEIAKIHPRSHE